MKEVLAHKTSSIVKQSMSVVAAFLIIGGTHYLTFSFMNVEGNALAPLFSLFTVLILTFLIVELNRKIKSSATAIGLILAFVYALPFLLQYAYFGLPKTTTEMIVVAHLIALPLASYVFETLWSKDMHLHQTIKHHLKD